jgi:hypothetical protein
MRQLIVAALAVFTLAGATAQAAPVNFSGYVCTVTSSKQNNRWYGQGYVYIILRTEPACAGSIVGHFYYHGLGAELPGAQHTVEERRDLLESAHAAAIAGKKVVFRADDTQGGIWETTYRAD